MLDTAVAQKRENGAEDIVQVHFARCCAFTGMHFPKEEEVGQMCVTDIAWVGFSVHADMANILNYSYRY